MDRKQQLEAWLNINLKQAFTLTTASADASFRRYFRVHLNQQYLDSLTLIAMDAPPPQEDCTSFVDVAKLLLEAGLNVPKVIAQDLQNGFYCLVIWVMTLTYRKLIKKMRLNYMGMPPMR